MFGVFFAKEWNGGIRHGRPMAEKIAYYRVDGGEVAIYTASIKGGAEKRIAIGMHPTWAPDGSEIAFMSAETLLPIRDGFGGIQIAKPRIEIINLRTGAKKQIVSEGFSLILAPAWSPDGTELAFSGIDPNEWSPGTRICPLYCESQAEWSAA